MDVKISLNNSEWEVMECLWEENPRTIMQIVKFMSDKLGWSKSTSTTMVRRMEAKGYIEYEEGDKARNYYPVLKRDEVIASEAQNLLDKAFAGRIGLLVNTLIPQNQLSEEDIKELEEVLHRAGGK